MIKMAEEAEIAVVGKDQIVIPHQFRKELAIKPNTKLCIYRKDDKLVVVKLEVPVLADLEDLFKESTNKHRKEKTNRK